MFDKKEWSKQYYIRNREKLLIKGKQYLENNREKENKRKKKWREENLEHKKEYYQNNCEKIKKQQKQYYFKNKEEIYQRTKEYIRQYTTNKRKTDLRFNLNSRMAIAIGTSLKGDKAGRRWESLVGYKLNDLVKRLKKTMPKGYTWQNYLRGDLHIDHILPKSIFNFTKSEHIDFKRCWALDNLRLLPAKENLIKHNKLNKPFQLALAI